MKTLKNDALRNLAMTLQCEPIPSESLRSHGFHPAFLDLETGTVHPSRHADGRPADEHVLDGLPDEVVVVRIDGGRVIAVRWTIVAGFERDGHFFTYGSAWRSVREHRALLPS